MNTKVRVNGRDPFQNENIYFFNYRATGTP